MNYDEAIKALKEVSGIVSHPEHNHLIEKISTALETAKKEHELLELYCKRFQFYNFDEDTNLKSIKELERELK